MQEEEPSYLGAPVDIFAVGVMLIALDTQNLPFELKLNGMGKKYQPKVTMSKYLEMQEKYIKVRAYKIQNGIPVIPDDAVKLIFACLHPNPKTRMTLDIIMELPYV